MENERFSPPETPAHVLLSLQLHQVHALSRSPPARPEPEAASWNYTRVKPAQGDHGKGNRILSLSSDAYREPNKWI